MKQARWVNYLSAYLLWVILLALGLWLLVISRESFLGAWSALYVGKSLSRAWQVRFYDKIYFLAAGLLWLAFMILSEAYLREGAGRRDLLRRFARLAGPEILLLFAADLILFLLQGAPGSSWLHLLILGSELIVGAGLFLLGRFRRKQIKEGVG